MKLELKPRQVLIARMQVWAYENIMLGNYPRAQKQAEIALRRFDDMMEANPLDSAGYWANFYFDQFKGACADM